MTFSGPAPMESKPDSGDSRLIVRFFLQPVFLEAKTKANTAKGDPTPLYEDQEFIEIIFPGDKNSVQSRQVTAHDKIRFADSYSRFKAGDPHSHGGTLLMAWADITPARIKTLEFFNVFTVEQLANLPDTAIQHIGMDGVDLRKRAQAFVAKHASDNAALRKTTEDLEKHSAQQAEQLEAMRAQIAALTANRKTGRQSADAE